MSTSRGLAPLSTRSILRTLAVASALGALLLGSPAQARSVRLAAATPVVLRVARPVSSGAVRVGDRVPLVVAEDVVVDGWLTVRRGAAGEAVVESVQPASGDGAGGSISLAAAWVRAVDRSRLGLSGSLSGTGGYRNAAGSSQPLNAGANIAYQTGLSGIGGALGRVTEIAQSVGVRSRGREATIDPDRSFPATIRNVRGVVVTSTPRAAGGADDDPVK